MSRRYKSRTMQFGKPLALPSSTRVERCYAIHGKGYGHPPPADKALELVMVNAARDVRTIIGQRLREHAFQTDAADFSDDWHILGWRVCDQSMPLGEYDAVDPMLAQIDYLPVPNPKMCPECGPIAAMAK